MNASTSPSAVQYNYTGAEHAHAHVFLLPVLDRVLRDFGPTTVFDAGCGNGSVAAHLAHRFKVTGIDASESGIEHANAAYPSLRLEVGSVYDDLAGTYGRFDAVVSLEVVEHLYEPRLYASRIFDLLRPGGIAVISTPFHGYWKNLAIALTNRWDGHFTALWDGGHIKFWSVRTLGELLEGAGFTRLQFRTVGRVPQLARSVIVVSHKPA